MIDNIYSFFKYELIFNYNKCVLAGDYAKFYRKLSGIDHTTTSYNDTNDRIFLKIFFKDEEDYLLIHLMFKEYILCEEV